MARGKYSDYIYIDGDKCRSIIAENTKLTYEQIGQCIGYSKSWLGNVLRAGRIGNADMKKLKTFLNIDLTTAVMTETEWEERTITAVVASSPDTPDVSDPYKSLSRMVDEYSYVRSNDIDRLIQAVDRLTEAVRDMVETFK